MKKNEIFEKFQCENFTEIFTPTKFHEILHLFMHDSSGPGPRTNNAEDEFYEKFYYQLFDSFAKNRFQVHKLNAKTTEFSAGFG